MYTNLTKRALLFAVLTAIFMVFSCYAYAQELNISDTTTFEAADTLDPDPEWYVAPLSRDSVRAGKRALVAAATCTKDSVQIFNVDSVLTGVSVYEYGDTTRTMTWTVNPDGSRFGTSRSEEKTSGDITFTASYEWDFTANDWKGISKEEHTFAGNNETLRTLYDWQNGAWSAKTQYTWDYAAGREVEYTTYTRNTAGNLVYSKQRLREYNAAGKLTQEINYTTYNGTEWTAGNKRIYDYDGNNTILNEYYSAYTNGSWVGSSREVWEYTSGKKTYYEKDTWSNGAWIGSSKELWVFSGNNQTLHEKYGWANSDWAITAQENSGYDVAGNNNLIENYTYTNGVQKGSKKEEYTFSGSTKVETVTYKWTNDAWVKNVKTVNNKVSNPAESCRYNWNGTAWVGSGNRTLTTNNSSNKPIEVITQTWSSEAGSWVNYTRATTEYTGTKTTQEATYLWQNDAWVGTSRSDWHYNTAGQNDTIKTYTNNGTEWIYSDRTAKTYNAAGTEIMTHNAHWDTENSKWVMTSMTRTDILDHVVDGARQTLNASWRCGADSVWIGVQKDTVAYSTTGKTLYMARFTSWANNDWVPLTQTEYAYNDKDYIIFRQTQNWSNNAWVNFNKYEYGWDANGRQTMEAQYNGDGIGWKGFSRWEKVYNDVGVIIQSITFSWKNNAWQGNVSEDYIYDAQGRTIEYKQSTYENGLWINFRLTTNAYDQRGQNTSTHKYWWNNNEWVFISLNDKWFDESDNKLRREKIGSWNNGVVSSFTDNHYFYSCDPKLAFTIRFVNENGTTLESKQVRNGAMPAYSGAEPTREATAEYTYTFTGWDKAIAEATADATYTATFSATKRQYTITWLNEDGSEISHETLEYGLTPAPADIYKESTAEYTYTFTGWDKEITPVNGDATYTAVFSATKRQYTVTWLNEDNSQLAQTTVEYGVMPTAPEAPSKGATAEYTYTFAGWGKELVAVEGDATYTATFTATKRQYTITWLNEDNSQLAQTTVEYGVIPTAPEAPSKGATAEYTYAFAGWDKELVAVEGDATYMAAFTATKNTYTITWLNSDNSPLYQEEVAYGVTPVYTGATPTQESTAEYTYTFVGWDSDPAPVTGAAIYKAVYSSNKNSYTVTFYFEDGVTVLDSQVLEYGETPSTGMTPSKNDEEHYYYTFTGWSPEITPVTGDASYTPVYKKEPKQYTITFNNYNGRPLWTTTVPYGDTPVYNGETPTRPRTQQYSYEFAGWSPELAPVTGNTTYTARFTETVNTYTITWLNSDNSPLYQDEVEYGTMPEYQGETPTKEPDAEYRYEFAGWTPRIVAVFTDATYTATYTRHDLHEGIDDVQPSCMEAQKVLRNGTFYILRGDKVYTTDGVLVE